MPKITLTFEAVKTIRRSPLSSSHFARVYGVNRSTICRVRKYRTWANLEGKT